ncbi:MAG: hypothetical protein ABWX67_16500 [Allosphingosinicella sp.]
MSAAGISEPAGPFLLAVVGAALTAAVMMSAGIAIDGSPAPPLPFLFVAAWLGAALVIALAAVLIGLPLTLLLARTGRESPWAYPAAGSVAGAAILGLFLRLDSPLDSPPLADLLFYAACFGAVPGGICGLLWWILYRRELQPERGG